MLFEQTGSVLQFLRSLKSIQNPTLLLASLQAQESLSTCLLSGSRSNSTFIDEIQSMTTCASGYLSTSQFIKRSNMSPEQYHPWRQTTIIVNVRFLVLNVYDRKLSKHNQTCTTQSVCPRPSYTHAHSLLPVHILWKPWTAISPLFSGSSAWQSQVNAEGSSESCFKPRFRTILVGDVSGYAVLVFGSIKDLPKDMHG